MRAADAAPRRSFFALGHGAADARVLQGNRMDRKLSDILIEIAMQGLKSPKYGNSEVMHPLMLLSHVAWNRDTKSPDYLERYRDDLARFPIAKRKLRSELISDDWPTILQRMIEYKQARFPDDKRVITLCGFTPWSTASFLILVAAIVFAAIARGHSVEISKTMAKAIQAKAESGSEHLLVVKPFC